MVLGAEAHAAVRAAQGAPEQLRIVATSTFAEFVAGPLMEAFRRRFPGAVEITTGVAASGRARRADREPARGRRHRARGSTGEQELPVVSEPIFKYRLVVVGPGAGGPAGTARPRGPARQWRWLVDPSGTDPGSETARLLRRLGVADSNIGVFQSQTAAWAAAADGAGVAPGDRAPGLPPAAPRRAVPDRPARAVPAEECWYVTLLERERRSTAASALRRFLGTPEAMQLMRSPDGRRAAVPLQAPGLRHDLELNRADLPAMSA